MNPENLPDKFRDFEWFAERFFSIRGRAREIIPFRMNDLQRSLYPALCGSDDVLKARKGGVSTLIELQLLHRALTRPNNRSLILAHEHRSAIELFDIIRTAYEHLPPQLKPRLTTDSRQEMRFAGIGSAIQAHTAKNPELGRGGTIDDLHCSEIAFWEMPETTLTAVGASLGSDPTIWRESTANGAGNYWHRQWLLGKKGRSGYKNHFFPWWIDSTYSVQEPDPVKDPDEFTEDGRPVWRHDPNEEFRFSERERELGLTPQQARWRRRAVTQFGEKFKQEYAEDDVTCFLTTGRNVFDVDQMQRMFEVLVLRDRLPEEIPELGLKIYHQFEKKYLPHLSFVAGADVSEGIADPTNPREHGDYSASYFIERRTGIQVASIHGLWEPDEFAHVLSQAALKYFSSGKMGPPFIGVERNEYGHATLNELWNHIRYQNLYWQEEFDERKQKMGRKLGWRTTPGNRSIMITELVKSVRERRLKVLDPDFVSECLTFTRNARGRPEAQRGCHDDRVMACAIAWQMILSYNPIPLMGVNLS